MRRSLRQIHFTTTSHANRFPQNIIHCAIPSLPSGQKSSSRLVWFVPVTHQLQNQSVKINPMRNMLTRLSRFTADPEQPSGGAGRTVSVSTRVHGFPLRDPAQPLRELPLPEPGSLHQPIGGRLRVRMSGQLDRTDVRAGRGRVSGERVAVQTRRDVS